MASAAVDSIRRSLSELCDSDSHWSWENPRKFCDFSRRLQLVLSHFLRLPLPEIEALPPSVQTALKGVSGDLSKAAEIVSVYKNRSKIFVLINCVTLSASLQDRSTAIGGWLSLLDAHLQDHLDLFKKNTDLSRDLKEAQFRVTENEERVYCTLQKEGKDRQTGKAVQSAIVMDLARALGFDFDNRSELSEQVRLFKDDLSVSNTIGSIERRILTSLERILENWSSNPVISNLKLNLDFEDEACILPFKNFVCPLTKEVMREPVVLESSQTYECSAIEYWFQRCVEDGRDPTCPVTGQVLKSLERKPNIGLAGAIEEWLNRNIDIQIKLSVQHLSADPPSMDCVEPVLENIYKISEEHPFSRYKIRNAGVVGLTVNILRNSTKSIGTHLRGKALIALVSMAKDEESKEKMLEDGVTRLAIHSLTGSSEKEREYALKLLLDFSSDDAFCARLASEKGASVLLSSIAGNQEYPVLSNIAEEILKQMEKLEESVQYLAAAGRFEPLVNRLCEGSDDVKIKMASMLGMMTLTNSSKEQIARQTAKALVDLLSNPEGRIPSLKALYNLSLLDDNASVLVDSTALRALADILFGNEVESPEPKELSASIIANIVSKQGHWELAPVDKKGNSMQSESIVQGLLGYLSFVSQQCQLSVLQILYGIASSPQASEYVTTYIQSGDGIRTIIEFLDHPEAECRIYAFRLIGILSKKFSPNIASDLKTSNKLSLVKDKLLDDQSADVERSEAACILAYLPLSEVEIKSLLGTNFVQWTVSTLKGKQWRVSKGRVSQPTSSMLEGLLGLLLHFTKSPDPQTLSSVKEHHLITIFRDQLTCPSTSNVKRLAAVGLKNLSESGRALGAFGDSEPQPPQGFFSSFLFMCGKRSFEPLACAIHNAQCEEDSPFCLHKSSCIKPLIDLIEDEDTGVQIASIEAISTLLFDSSNSFKRAVDVLDQLGMVGVVVKLFTSVRPGELQERTIWIIERVLRIESHSHKLSLDQSLVRALVDALKHGNANTKRLAQDALTNLKQISGISGRASNQSREHR